MAEYIDKNKILDRLDRLMHIATEPPMDADDKAQWVLLRELHKEIFELPTADVEEVKQWQFVRNERNIPKMKEFHKKGFALSMNEKSIFYTCSECGEWISLSQKYCSECGAKMDGGKGE